MKDLAAVGVLCLLAGLLIGSACAIDMGHMVRLKSIESKLEDIYTLYLQQQTDREQAELDYKIRNGLPL